MNRKKKILKNIIMLTFLFIFLAKNIGLYLTPLAAHRASEKSIHYGPSEVVHIEDFDEGKYILCKYDKWISCNTVNKSLFFFWRIGNQVTGIENDKTKVINLTWGGSQEYYRFYGIINDERIDKVEILLDNGKTFVQTEFYDKMFLFTDSVSNNRHIDVVSVKGYDFQGRKVYEEEY